MQMNGVFDDEDDFVPQPRITGATADGSCLDEQNTEDPAKLISKPKLAFRPHLRTPSTSYESSTEASSETASLEGEKTHLQMLDLPDLTYSSGCVSGRALVDAQAAACGRRHPAEVFSSTGATSPSSPSRGGASTLRAGLPFHVKNTFVEVPMKELPSILEGCDGVAREPKSCPPHFDADCDRLDEEEAISSAPSAAELSPSSALDSLPSYDVKNTFVEVPSKDPPSILEGCDGANRELMSCPPHFAPDWERQSERAPSFPSTPQPLFSAEPAPLPEESEQESNELAFASLAADNSRPQESTARRSGAPVTLALDQAIPAATSASSLIAVGYPGEPSKGSEGHDRGECQPCAFVYKPEGCKEGADCPFCHLCSAEERKKRKKEKNARLRQARLSGSSG